MTSRRSRGTPWTLLIVVGAVGVAILGGFLFLRLRSQESNADALSGAPSASKVADLEALLNSPAGSAAGESEDPRNIHILSKTSLSEAIETARPMMSNTIGRLDVGSALLAMWASKNLSWQALDALPETSPALFKKDPDSERGRRFCMSGTVLEIRAEKTMSNRLVEDKSTPLIEPPTPSLNDPSSGSMQLTAEANPSASASANPLLDPMLRQGMDFGVPDGGKVFFATVVSKSEAPSDTPRQRLTPRAPSTFVEVIAVRSTGNIVDGSDARVCGVLTGVTVPPDVGSTGTTIEAATMHRIVGMFDLPQNRLPNAVEVASQHG